MYGRYLLTMKEIFLGTLVKKRRHELNISQEELCLGICEPITISRLENGQQFPRRYVLTAIMDRLDLPSDRYYAIFNKEDEDFSILQFEIDSLLNEAKAQTNASSYELVSKIHKKIEKLKNDFSNNDTLILQFIKIKELELLKLENQISLDVQLDLSLKALQLTVPKIDLNQIHKSLLSLFEINIISDIANIYAQKTFHDKALILYQQLLDYSQSHFKNLKQSGTEITSIAYSYGQELLITKHYKEAIDITEFGIQVCVNHAHYHFLSSLIQIQAESWFYLGDNVKSRALFYQAYYIYKAIDNPKELMQVKKIFYKYFHTEMI